MARIGETIRAAAEFVSKAVTSAVEEVALAGLEELAKRKIAPQAERLFLEPTQNWRHKPQCSTTVQRERRRVIITLSHTSQIYEWLDEGTRKDEIYPVNRVALSFFTPFSPSTEPWSLRSRSQFRGNNQIFARVVRTRNRPYWIRPRRFTEQINDEISATLPDRLKEFVQVTLKRELE